MLSHFKPYKDGGFLILNDKGQRVVNIKSQYRFSDPENVIWVKERSECTEEQVEEAIFNLNTLWEAYEV